MLRTARPLLSNRLVPIFQWHHHSALAAAALQLDASWHATSQQAPAGAAQVFVRARAERGGGNETSVIGGTSRMSHCVLDDRRGISYAIESHYQ